MRIKQLLLKAFGPFTDRTLDFTSTLPGLHVVYGPNEAGKSSSMRALQALFFGFPSRTGDDFIHAYNQLLVGGTLEGSDGRELTFFRRKKNKNSLFDKDDNQLEQAALTPFLHGLEQDIFTTLYGIDHETLVKGGQGILDQQGEVGQALFAAGTGLASLKSIVDELEGEGESLFKPRGSSQAISVEMSRYREMQSQIKLVTLSSREWQDHQRALDDAVKKLDETNEMRGRLNREKRQYERLKQALPYLGERRGLLERVAELEGVVELPSDFGERRKALEQQERETGIRLETSKSRLIIMEEKRKGVSLNQGLLDHAEAIEEMLQKLGQYRKGRIDRPQLDGRRIGCHSDAANLLKQIKPGSSIDQIELLRPGISKRKTIQTLGARHEAVVKTVRSAGRLLQNTAKNLETARNDLQKLALATDVEKLSFAVKTVQKQGDMDGEIMTRRQRMDHARKESLTALNRLGCWSGALDQLAQLAVPLPETLSLYEEKFRSTDEEKRQLQVERTQCDGDLGQIMAQLNEIESAAEVPTEEDLAQFRGRRDQGWQLLKRQWIQNEDVAAESLAYDPENPLPFSYEKQVGLSDQTADRLYREADRVQKHAALKARADVIEKRLNELKRLEESADLALAELARRWHELWEPCAIKPLSPREMQAWLIRFDKLRFQVEESDKITREIEGLETRRGELRKILLAELAGTGEQRQFPGEELSQPLQFAEGLLKRIQEEDSRRRTLEGKTGDLQNTLDTAHRELSDAEEELKQWESLWEDAVKPLGIPGNTPPTEAIDFIETLQGCFDKLKEGDDFQKRIDGIDRDVVEFEETVKALVKGIAPDLYELETPQAVSQLKSRIDRASQGQAVLRQYAEEIESLNNSIAEAETQLISIVGQITALRQLAGCENEEQLNEAERRSNEYQRVKEKLEEVQGALTRIAEGISLADLEKQAQEVDPDFLPGQIDGLTREIELRLDPEIGKLSEVIGREKHELERMDGSGKAAELADASQQALARIRRLTERYIRLKLATRILREEIERYRAENQDPVLKIASRYFSELTEGAFAGLRTDIDDQGQPVLIGVRPNGAWLHVGGMSSGTSDQLYLALRLATLEWRIQSSEPMPFIVDDILINFDDQRSKATLKAFSNLAEKTQVILFTHHSQIFEAAQAINSSDRVFIHKL